MTLVDLACAYSHAIAVPLQSNLPSGNLAEIFSDTSPVTLIASIDNLEEAAAHAEGLLSVRSLIVIDADEADDDERERIDAVRHRLLAGGDRVALATFAELACMGAQHVWMPLPRQADCENALRLLIYTSGSTGAPKGAMIHETMCKYLWNGMPIYRPTIQVVSAPFNHIMGRSQVFTVLASGGTAYFTLKSDMSTLFEDIRIVRPTNIPFLPRICEIVYQHYCAETQRRVAQGQDAEQADAEIRQEMRASYFGDRLVSAGVGSAPVAQEVRDFIRDCFDITFFDAYSSTELGPSAMIADGHVQRDVVLDYKLIDVPELGYYTTDHPYPRGEFLAKSRLAFKGYFKRPEATAAVLDDEGWLHTGDIMEERGRDQLTWLGRRNNVLKLSQGEYVALPSLEATYLGNSALIRQIYLYGSSYRSFLLAVVVPDTDVARAQLGHGASMQELRGMILAEFQEVGRIVGLKSFEIPRDVIVELEPFTHENGLLSSVRKPLYPKLKARFQLALEEMYQDMERKQQEDMALLRDDSHEWSTLERVAAALKSSLLLATVDAASQQSYTDLGGDSLGAVSFALLLEDLFGVAVPVSVILDPAGSVSHFRRFRTARSRCAEPTAQRALRTAAATASPPTRTAAATASRTAGGSSRQTGCAPAQAIPSG
jgi:fatty acid CoA ligase FadD9